MACFPDNRVSQNCHNFPSLKGKNPSREKDSERGTERKGERERERERESYHSSEGFVYSSLSLKEGQSKITEGEKKA